MAPVAHGEKGTHKDLLEDLRKEGYVRVRVNGEMLDLSEEINLEKNKKDNIDVIIDRIVLKDGIVVVYQNLLNKLSNYQREK